MTETGGDVSGKGHHYVIHTWAEWKRRIECHQQKMGNKVPRKSQNMRYSQPHELNIITVYYLLY